MLKGKSSCGLVAGGFSPHWQGDFLWAGSRRERMPALLGPPLSPFIAHGVGSASFKVALLSKPLKMPQRHP